MKDLREMTAREFAKALAEDCSRYDRLQVYDYLQIQTDGFEIGKTYALLSEVNDIIMNCLSQNREYPDNSLLWYSHKTLCDVLEPNGKTQSEGAVYSSYLLQAFGNNALLIDKFFERIASIPGERKTTPIAIEIDALKSLGVLNMGKLTTFTDELNKALASHGMTEIKYKSLSDKLGDQRRKHENEFKVAVSIYDRLLDDKSE